MHSFLNQVQLQSCNPSHEAGGLTTPPPHYPPHYLLLKQSLDLFEVKALVSFRADRHRISNWRSLTKL